MKMNQSYILKFKRGTYDIAYSANSAFYAFMGDRFYYPFDQIANKDDLKILEEQMENNDMGLFPLRLIDTAGNSHWCVVQIIELTEEDCTVEIQRFEDIKHLFNFYEINLLMITYILEIYGDTYFEYDARNDGIKIITAHKSLQLTQEISREEFERRLLKNADAEMQIKISTFMMTMSSGSGYNSIIVNSGNILEDSEKDSSILVKVASYTLDDGNIKACGYIHEIIDGEKGYAMKLPEIDYLTGVLNKAEITKLAINKINTKKIPNTTIAILDVDHFKAVNDTFGHQKGDEVLKKVAQIIEREAGPNSLTGRIGGDEFLVIFSEIDNMEKNREYLRGMKNAIHMEYPPTGAGPQVSLSIGCASYPKDADNYNDILTLADYALYLAKSKGKDRYIIYDAQKHDSLAEIQETNKKDVTATGYSRGDMTASNAVCTVYDRLLNSSNYELQKLLDDICGYMRFDRVVLYAGAEHQIMGIAGDKEPGFEILQENADYLSNEAYLAKFSDRGVLVLNNISFFANRIPEVYEKFEKQKTLSAMQFHMKDKNGTEFILSIEATQKLVAWNQENMKYYRLIANAISLYELM